MSDTTGSHGIMSSVQNELEMIITSYFVKDKKYISKILERGVTKEWFLSEDLAIFFGIAKECWDKYRCTFTRTQFVDRAIRKGIDSSVVEHYTYFYDELYGDKYSQYTEDDLPAMLDQFEETVNVHRALEAAKLLNKKLDEVHESPKKAVEAFKKLVSNINFNENGKTYQVADLKKDGRKLVFEDAKERVENPKKKVGLKTSINCIDERFNGFSPQKMYIIFGLTSSGKTSLARQFGVGMFRQHHKKVLVISCEETAQDYLQKIACHELQISLKRMLRGQLTPEELEKIDVWEKEMWPEDESDEYGWFKVLEVPARKFSIEDIDDIIDREFGDEHIDCIILDQLSLLKPLIRRGDSTHLEYGDTSVAFRDMAKRRNCICILLAQANRKSVVRERQKRIVDVNVENLEGSGKPAQDADTVFAIFRPPDEVGIVTLRCVKQRDGEAGWEVSLGFAGDRCTFYEDSSNQLPVLSPDGIVAEADSIMSADGSTYLKVDTPDGEKYYDPVTKKVFDELPTSAFDKNVKISEQESIPETDEPVGGWGNGSDGDQSDCEESFNFDDADSSFDWESISNLS